MLGDATSWPMKRHLYLHAASALPEVLSACNHQVLSESRLVSEASGKR